MGLRFGTEAVVSVAGVRSRFGGPCGGIVRHGGDGMRASAGEEKRACMYAWMGM